MKPRWVIAQRELAGVFKERTILLAVIIQVVVAGFSSFLVIGLSALVDPDAFPLGGGTTLILDQDAANDTKLLEALRSNDIYAVPITAPFDDFEGSTDADVWNAFVKGGSEGALFARPTPDGGIHDLTLVLPEGDLRTTLTLSQVKKALESYERGLRSDNDARLAFDPIYVDNDAKAGSFSFVYSLLIPLLIFLPVILAGALCADSITEEVQRKTLPLLLASPATPADVVEGKLLANCAVAPILALAWFFLLGLNDLSVPWLGAMGILILATAISYLLGLLACAIALITRDRNKAHVTYASAMFLLLGLSLALPVSPVNGVALLAAGSAHAGVWLMIGGLVLAALAGAIGLRIALRRSAQWMAAGGA